MPMIKINKDGYVSSPYIKNADIDVEISEEQMKKISTLPMNTAWKYVNNDFILETLYTDDALKNRRQRECFNIIDNRSPMWYNHLTKQQKDELGEWYQAWLDVTETKEIPIKPEWLK